MLLCDEERVAELLRLLLVELWLRTVLFLLFVLVLRCGVATLLLLRVVLSVRTVVLRFDVVLRCGVATLLLLRGALSDRTVLLRFVVVLLVVALGVA